eukprot:g7562.t1
MQTCRFGISIRRLLIGFPITKLVSPRTSPAQFQIRNVASSRPETVTDISDEFNFKAYMASRATLVHQHMDSILPLEYPEDLTESMRYSLLSNGKKIRPALCLATCELCGGSIEQAMPTASACEMIHVMSLIHDDLPSMDNDDFRRGQPTTHVKFGEDIAVLTGDALLSFAFEHVARDSKDVSAERLLKVVGYLGKAVGARGLVGGQAADIKSEGKKVDKKTLEYIHLHKTAALLEAAVLSGATIAGANEDELNRLGKYARNIGLAFQVIDDILDITQTTEQLGKTAAKDLKANKTTYPKLLGLERSKEVAAELINDAINQLDCFDQKKAAPLIGLAKYIRDRKK